MLDTARHFAPMSTLIRVVDLLSALKLNVFHWHLTDAEVRLDASVAPMTVHQWNDIAVVSN